MTRYGVIERESIFMAEQRSSSERPRDIFDVIITSGYHTRSYQSEVRPKYLQLSMSILFFELRQFWVEVFGSRFLVLSHSRVYALRT